MESIGRERQRRIILWEAAEGGGLGAAYRGRKRVFAARPDGARALTFRRRNRRRKSRMGQALPGPLLRLPFELCQPTRPSSSRSSSRSRFPAPPDAFGAAQGGRPQLRRAIRIAVRSCGYSVATRARIPRLSTREEAEASRFRSIHPCIGRVRTTRFLLSSRRDSGRLRAHRRAAARSRLAEGKGSAGSGGSRRSRLSRARNSR